MSTESKLNVFREEFPWLNQAVAECQVFNLGEKRLKDVKVSRVDGELLTYIPKRPHNPTVEMGLQSHNGELLAEFHIRDKDGDLVGRYNLEQTPMYRTRPFRWFNPLTWLAFDSEPISNGQQPSWWINAKHVGLAPTVGEWLISHDAEDAHFLVWFQVCHGGLKVMIYKPPKDSTVIELARTVQKRLQSEKEVELAALRQEIAK